MQFIRFVMYSTQEVDDDHVDDVCLFISCVVIIIVVVADVN